MTKSERLLREIKIRGSMTHGEIVQFLLDLRDGFGNTEYDYEVHGSNWNALLYGTKERTGLLERFCDQNEDGSYSVVRKISAPFTKARRVFQDTHEILANQYVPSWY